MFHLQFHIVNPWSHRFHHVFSRHGKTPFKNKYWEFEVLKTSDIVDFRVTLTHRQSHAGFDLSIGLLGYTIEFNFYDCRHWDFEKNQWEEYTNDKHN